MTTLQEYLNQKYPTKEDKEKVKSIEILGDYSMHINGKKEEKNISTWDLELNELNLKEYTKLEKIDLCKYSCKTPLIKLDISGCNCLTTILLTSHALVSIDFLNTLPNPEKLENLCIFNNNIQPTDISIFSRFVNLKGLKIGTMKNALEEGKRNKFYGSFESWKDLTKLGTICIEATDVNEGLEYLSMNLAQKTREVGYDNIECSPHYTSAKCSAIQDQLRTFDYDLLAWQLAHPHLMYKARPELFFDSEVKTKWMSALRDKLNQTQTKLTELKQTNPNKVKKIKRLETKIHNLKLIQENISAHSLIEKLETKKEGIKEVQDKSTQTEDPKTQNQATQTEQKYEIPGSWKWK